MANPKTKFVKVRYEAVLEFDAEQSGIPDDSVLTQVTRILAAGVADALGEKKRKTLRGVSKAKYTVGLYFHPKPKKKG